MFRRTTRSSGRGTHHARQLVVLGALLSVLVVPAAASANPGNITTGQAYDLAVKTSLLGTLATAGPVVGPVTTNPFSQSSHTANLSTSLASLETLSASVNTTNEGSNSTATVASAKTFGGLPAISATVIQATASATCRNHGTTTGSGVTGTVKIAGQTYNLANEPANTVINLGVGTITLNEQVKTGNSVTVNAIDVRVPLVGLQAVIASANAGVSNCH